MLTSLLDGTHPTLSQALDTLVAGARACRADPSEAAALVPQLQSLLGLIYFQAVTSPHEQAVAAARSYAPRPRSPGALTCAVLDCNAGFPLWNINSVQGRAANGVEWRCRAHLPPDRVFPLTGEKTS